MLVISVCKLTELSVSALVFLFPLLTHCSLLLQSTCYTVWHIKFPLHQADVDSVCVSVSQFSFLNSSWVSSLQRASDYHSPLILVKLYCCFHTSEIKGLLGAAGLFCSEDAFSDGLHRVCFSWVLLWKDCGTYNRISRRVDISNLSTQKDD